MVIRGNRYKLVLFIFLMCYSKILSSAEIKSSIPGLTKEVYDKFCGEWTTDLNVPARLVSSLSWGKALSQSNFSLIIDLGSEVCYFLLEGPGVMPIVRIDKVSSNEFNFTIKKSVPKDEEIKVKVYYNEDGTILFGKESYMLFDVLNKYYKLDGPDIPVKGVYFIVKENLRLRETPYGGKVIRVLLKGERLEFIRKNREETINGVKGTWVKVKTEQGEVGWCFDGYLEKVR